MVTRIRRTVNRTARWLPAAAVIAAGACLAGLGLHTIHDWHHHGRLGAGLFHLHFHIGDHHHDDTETRGRDDGDHEPGSPEPRSAFFTVAQGFPDAAPSCPLVGSPEVALEDVPDTDHEPLICTELPADSSPRAPPA